MDGSKLVSQKNSPENIKGNMQTSDRPRFIVLPIKPGDSQTFNGIGLGIHFLLGNVMAVHTELKEFWFGWRVNKIFLDQKKLIDYCRGKSDLQSIPQLATDQDIRYWLSGSFTQKNDKVLLKLKLTDVGETLKQYDRNFELNPSDQAIGFRKEFLQWLNDSGLPMPAEQVPMALWPEKISLQGLDYLGRAMETTYLSFFNSASDEKPIDLHWFDQAVSDSPESYLSWDVKGWALYKNRDYESAFKVFKSAITFNRKGLGVLSGLMWCCIYANEAENACRYAIEKADVRNESRENARNSVAKKISKIFS